METDHHEQLEDIEKQHQTQVSQTMSNVDNENAETIKTDIKVITYMYQILIYIY